MDSSSFKSLRPNVVALTMRWCVAISLFGACMIFFRTLILSADAGNNNGPVSALRPRSVPVAEADFEMDSPAHTYAEILELVNSTENKAVFQTVEYLEGSFYDEDSNLVGTVNFPRHHQFQRQPYVSNGYIGSRIPCTGLGFTYDTMPEGLEEPQLLQNGWPLFNSRYAGAFAAGFFNAQPRTEGVNFPELLENGWESVIAAIPQWTTLNLNATISNKTFSFNPATINETDSLGAISNYSQSLSLAHGTVNTLFVWEDTLSVVITVVANRAILSLGTVDLSISNIGTKNAKVLVESVLDFESAQRCTLDKLGSHENGIYMSFSPEGVHDAFGAIYSNLSSDGLVPVTSRDNSSVSQALLFDLDSKSSIRVLKYSGIVTSDLDPEQLSDPELVLSAATEVVSNVYGSIDSAFQDHLQEWENIMGVTPAITFENDRYLTLASRASLYHLLTNSRPNASGVTAALSVAGLSSDSYAGLVFWDTDLWILNAILPFSPDTARSIPEYRMHLRKQAQLNLKEGDKGAVYPWTSGRYGNCTATGPCYDYEYHINYDIAQAAWNVYLSGGVDEAYLKDVTYPLINDAAEFFESGLVKFNQTLGKYTTKNLTDPDEYANHVDNGAFTNTAIARLMQWHVDLAKHLGILTNMLEKYKHIADNMYMPIENDIVLEYSGMNASIEVKQADVILISYPLENEMITDEQALINMQFYAAKQVNYGPAMTFSIFSILGSKIAQSGCSAYSYLNKAIQPFLRGPFAQMSEQNNDDFLVNGGTHPAFPFLTGHGGFVQASLQGLTGWRFDYILVDGKIERVLELDPVQIPCLSGDVIFEGLRFNNNSLTLILGEETLSVKNNGPDLTSTGSIEPEYGSVRIRLGKRNSLSSQLITVPQNRTVKVDLFRLEPSFPDSITECSNADFFAIDDGAFGDLPLLMNDGDNSTNWQARYNDTLAKIFVDLKSQKLLASGYINWGEKPPLHLKISIYNDTKYESFSDFEENVEYGVCNSTKLECLSSLFKQVVDTDVAISAPFDMEEFQTIQVATRHNITSFGGFNETARFVLIEIQGIHNEAALPGDVGGAKIYEVVMYDS